MTPDDFRRLTDVLPEPMLLLSGDGRVLAGNRSAFRRLHLDPEQLAGAPFSRLVVDPPEEVGGYLRACSRSGDRIPGAFRFAGDGRVGRWRCEGAVLDPAEEPERRRIVLRLLPQQFAVQQFAALSQKVEQLAREIRRRERAEDELRKQQEHLQTTLHSIGDAVVVTDAEGRITSMNPIARALTGWGEEGIGQPLATVFRIVNETSGRPADNPVEKVLRTGVVVGLANHTALIGKDGVWRPISDSAAPIRDADGRVAGVVLVFRDVTEERESEKAIRQSEEQLRLALEAGRMGTWEWAVATNEVRWSPSLEALHGLAPGSFPGTFEAFQSDIHPDDRQRVFGSIRAALETGRQHRIEYRIVLPDGSLRWVEARGRVFRDEAGQPAQMLGVCTDVTDRKQAEEQLREENRATETLNRLSTVLLSELDLDRLAQITTDEATRLVGAQFGAFFHNVVDADGESYVLYSLSGAEREHFEKFPLPRATALFGPTFRGEGVIRLDDVMQDPRYGKSPPYYGLPPGHLPVRSYLAAPVVSRSGEVLGGLFFGHSDVGRFSDRDERLIVGVAAQAAIAIDNARLYGASQESEKRLRQLADSMPQVVWAARPDGFVDYYNKRWYDSFAVESGPQEGDASWLPVIHPDDVPRTLERWYASVRSGEPYEIEQRCRQRKTGTYRWHLVRGLPVRNGSGEIVRWYGTSTDIEEQKRAEQTSRFLADASVELANLLDYESTLQKVANLAVPDFADWCTVDLVEPGGSLRRLAVMHTDPDKVRLAYHVHQRYPSRPDAPVGPRHVLRTGASELVGEIPPSLLEQVAQDEEHLEILRTLGLRSYISVPLLVQGRVFGVLTFVLSESGYHYNQRDLTLAEDLARRAAVAIDNARLYAELKTADRRKNEFLAMLAHELRNPLAPIRSGLDFLTLEGDGNDTVQLMMEQVEYLVRLVDDLLDVSRIMQGKIQLRKEPVELATIVERALDMARLLIEEKQHRLEVRLPDEPVWLEGDPVRLTQVITNLLNNAAKYTDRGGRIELSAERRDAELAIRVRDDGVGIDSSLLPHVFELFTQADRSLDRSQGGLGIGLTLVHTLVELHGGTVTAHSEGQNRGSEFMIRLPVIRSAGPQRHADPAGATEEARRRILVVDDTPAAAKMLQLVLAKLGNHEIHVAHDGPAALEAAQRHRPDIVFLDIGLPRMDGSEVARRLRAQPEFQHTLLVALTGYGQQEDRRRTREAGFDEHLVKPASLDGIRRMLEHAKLQRPGASGA